MKPDIFPYLVIGLAKFLEQKERNYPYPEVLHYSLNRLSLDLRSDYPKTTSGLIELFAKPLCDWWPGELTSEFDRDEPLIEDNQLSFEAMIYLDRLSEQDNTFFQDSLASIGIIVDNHKFKQILQRLRNKTLTDVNGAQDDYVTLRRFIIEHPFALQRDISRVFSQTKYINSVEVSELYIKTNEIKDILQYPDAEGKQLFWFCKHCGPLHVKNAQRQSIKSSVCGSHCPRHQGGWDNILPTNQLNVLRRGIHLRVQLPGIPELGLFNWLEEQQQKYSQFLKQVTLWPRIDMYDLQINFVDSVWAIDIKDYEKPYQLGRNLKNLYREGGLYWDKGFYVYPAYRDNQRQDYGEVVRLEASKRLQDIEVVNDQNFKAQVMQKLKSLKRGNPNVQDS